MEPSCTIAISMKPLKTKLQRVDIVIMDALDACHLCYPGNCAILCAPAARIAVAYSCFSLCSKKKEKKKKGRSKPSSHFQRRTYKPIFSLFNWTSHSLPPGKSIASFSSRSCKVQTNQGPFVRYDVGEKRTFKLTFSNVSYKFDSVQISL